VRMFTAHVGLAAMSRSFTFQGGADAPPDYPGGTTKALALSAAVYPMSSDPAGRLGGFGVSLDYARGFGSTAVVAVSDDEDDEFSVIYQAWSAAAHYRHNLGELSPVFFGEVCHQTSPRRGQAPGEPPLRDAPSGRRAPLCFLERFVTKPLLAGVTPPASLLSETRPSGPLRAQGDGDLSVGEVCRQTSPRRGQVPGEPPLRDARLWRVGGSARVGGDLGRGAGFFWRGLSPNLSSPGPGPRRASSPRRVSETRASGA
jgi:hypothetical protein